jgi:hypothetical protein
VAARQPGQVPGRADAGLTLRTVVLQSVELCLDGIIGEEHCCDAGAEGADVNVYWFEVEVARPVIEDDLEALGDVLTAADGLDATPQADERGDRVVFSRDAEDAVQAIVSAVRDIEAAGMKVTGVIEDRVTAAEIADRAMVTTACVRYWITGERGPGSFPLPIVRRQRASTFSWAEVAAWLAWAKLGDVDHVAAETAQACLIIDAAVTVRNGLRDMPRHNRPLIRELVT